MTNNDFDFIKKKFDESSVNAPDKLNEEFVKAQINNIEPLKENKTSKKFIIRVSIAAVIAAILVNAILITSVFGILNKGSFSIGDLFIPNKNGTVLTANIKSFANYDEIKKSLQEIFNYDNYYDYPYDESKRVFGNDLDSQNEAAEIGSKGGNLNGTYTQVLGVDEADTVKTDGEYIYYMDTDRTISIIKTDNGKTELKNKLKIPKINEISHAVFSDFYIYNDKLIALIDSSNSSVTNTGVYIYDISDKSNITLSDRFIQCGTCCSSRMIDNKLYIVSSAYAKDEDFVPYVYDNKSTDDEASQKKLEPSDIYSVESPSRRCFSVASYIDVEKSAHAVTTKAFLGSANEIYCNTENLYITARNNVWLEKLNRSSNYNENIAREYTTEEHTQIVKVKLNETLDFIASCKVKGYINNQYSLDEYDGNVRVSTTFTSKAGTKTNNLYVLDSKLKSLGKVTGFAKNEDIRAVRYVEDTAFVITYEEIDPLFIIDLSDPRDPEITGSVNISGYSTLIVPVDKNTILGIGYGSTDSGVSLTSTNNGVKIVTFDISDKSAPKVLDTKIYDYCSSAVQNDPKALLVNFDRGDFTIPLNYEKYNYSNIDDSDAYQYPNSSYEEESTIERHSGVLNFRVDNGKINVIDNYVSDEFGYYAGNTPVDRCVYIGDYIYLLGVITWYDEDEYYQNGYVDHPDHEDHESELVIDSVKYK